MGSHIFPLFQAHVSEVRFAFRVVRIEIVGRIVFCFFVLGRIGILLDSTKYIFLEIL
jgi:hypothetical protein